jgi:hypothetical protein
MVYRKRKRIDNIEAGAPPAAGSQVPIPETTKGSLTGTSGTNRLTTKPGGSTAMEVPQGLRSDPSIIVLNTPPRPSSTRTAGASKTRQPRRGLRSSPSLQVIDHVSAPGQSRRPRTFYHLLMPLLKLMCSQCVRLQAWL